VEEDSPIKLIDWGASRVFDSGKRMKHTIGTIYYFAPEVLKQNYDEKCDIWSCGVILYILLAGRLPFDGETDEEIKKKIMKGSFKFYETEFSDVSVQAKDLISKMLTLDTKSRISAQEAVNHPWFLKVKEKQTRDTRQRNTKILKNLCEFNVNLTQLKLNFFLFFRRTGFIQTSASFLDVHRQLSGRGKRTEGPFENLQGFGPQQ
jgi:calcium-dependent protein kinase